MREHTITPMDRQTLLAMLDRAAGLEGSDGTYRTRDGHEVTLYLGRPGNAMALQHVESVTAADAFIEVAVRDRGTLYAPYEALHALLDGTPKATGPRRGGVGF